jgi:WD40 repeat protein/predicted Ser/Thr protein kinase
MATGKCHSPTALEAFAAGCADAAVGAHIGECTACRAAVEEARANNILLAGVRRALEAHGGGGRAEGPAPVEPDLVSGYQIQEEIHRGGQGVVYRAIQTRTNRVVAIKMLLGGKGASGRQKERFEREVRIAAGLRHPNIVTVHDSGYASDGRYALVMEYIEGEPLDRWSRSLDLGRSRDARRQALRERMTVMVEVCDAVLYAHQHSIVHRDLKPANILVDAQGRPHILDFGIARDTGPEQHTRLTNTGEFAGTLAYASPEQVAGDPSKVDTRTDIYSLGVIMYELVSGTMPYAVDGPMSRIIRGIESADPLPLPRRSRAADDPWVDGEVSTIILKAMAKDPARRYQTAAGLGNDIARYLAGEAIEARRDSTWYILRKTAARHRIVLAAAGLLIVTLAVFGGAMARQAYRLEVRGQELASALRASNIERGRMHAALGRMPPGDFLVFPELTSAGVTRIDGPEAGFDGPPEALHAYWALWDMFRHSRYVARLLKEGVGAKGGPENILLYFDTEGRRLSALDGRGRLTTWSVATWEPLHERTLFDPGEGAGFAASLSPSGNVAVLGGGVLQVFDPETGSVEARVEESDEQARLGPFSPDGTLLAIIGGDLQVRLLDARSLADVVTIAELTLKSNPSGNASRPAFSPDGSVIAAGRPDGSLGVWSTGTGRLERILPPPESLGRVVRVGSIVSQTVVIGEDGTIAAALGTNLVVWPADGSPARDLGLLSGVIQTVEFLPGSAGRVLVTTSNKSGGQGRDTTTWDLATGGQSATFDHDVGSTRCAASPDGCLIAVSDIGGRVVVYEVDLEPHVAVLQEGVGRGAIAALSPDGKLVAMTAMAADDVGRDILLMDLEADAIASRLYCDRGPIGSLVFSADGSSLLVGEASGRVTQWNPASGSVREFAVPDSAEPERRGVPIDPGLSLFEMRLSADGNTLALPRNDGLISLWDVASGRWVGWLDGGASDPAAIDFSPDGATLVARHREKCVIWNVPSRRINRAIAGDGSFPVARFSADGSVIASGINSRIEFVSVASGDVVMENNVPGTAGVRFAFHPGGNILFASAWDDSIRLWDTRTGRELLALEKHTSLVRTLLVTPDGNTLISSDSSGMVLAWDLGYYNDRMRRELAFWTAREAEK